MPKYLLMSCYRFLIILIGLFCLLSRPALAAEECEGENIVIPHSISDIQAAAKAGDPHAQAILGVSYVTGHGVNLDVTKGLSLLEKSAAANNSEGQFLLGAYYWQNGKAENDFRVAAKWFRKSADQGCNAALLYLGLLTRQGKGVPRNNAEGVKMITRAAKAGHARSETILGTMLINGDGVNKDVTAGFNWIKRAADSGDSNAELVLAKLYFNGTGTARNLSAAQALARAVYAKRDALAPAAAYLVGRVYLDAPAINKFVAAEWMGAAAYYHFADSRKLEEQLVNDLPKKKLDNSCGIYSTPNFADKGSKVVLRANKGEVLVLKAYDPARKAFQVYLPAHAREGFISRKCLGSTALTRNQIKKAEKNPVHIYDVKQGTMNIKTRQIDSTNKTIKYSEDGTCDMAGQTVPCMHMGIEYDYRNAIPNSWLECRVKSSQPAHYVDIDNRGKIKVRSKTYRVFLAQGTNHIIKGDYVNKEPGDKGIFTLQLKCSYYGREVLSTHYSIDLN